MSVWADTVRAESVGNHWMCAGACTAKGLRAANEDAHVLRCDWRVGSPPAALCAVMDGHGGSEVSNFLQKRIAQAVRAKLDEPGCWFSQATRRKAVESAFFALDSTVESVIGKEFATTSGSTCTMAAVWPEPCVDASCQSYDYRLMLSNLGDTRGIVVRSAQVLFETKDHKPEVPAEAQRIREAGGNIITPQRGPGPARVDNDLACARSFGDHRLKQNKNRGPGEQKISIVPDVFEFECQRGDIVVLACDGVFDVLTSMEVARLVHDATARTDGEVAAIASAVVVEALDRGTTDNVSCVVMQLMDPPEVGDVDWRRLGAPLRPTVRASAKAPTARRASRGPKTSQPIAQESVQKEVIASETSLQLLQGVGFSIDDVMEECVPLVPPLSTRPRDFLHQRRRKEELCH
eukprot:TRINITY_DN14515_c0_g1_i1.p1 TRINITY_DN14515_c0_g1~~TRINITY_DN14515_c0_g1_i1.p1  ORF type:complete len:406 (+),score=46.76 TRINITY_DN14515_c0_g1_i1:127-1344(+)